MNEVKVTHVGKFNPNLFGPTLLHLIDWLKETGRLPVEADVADIVAEYEEEPVSEVEVVA